MANGVVDLHPRQDFEVLIANFSKKQVQLPKHTVLGYASRHPLAILTPNSKVAQQVSKVLNLTPLTADSQSTVSDGAEPGAVDSVGELRKTLDLSHIEDESLRHRTYRMLSKHSEMWSGKLGTIHATEHRIEVEKGTHPIRSLPYRQGPAMRRVAAEQIQEQLDAGVIEPCTSEWASPIVFVPKKDGTLRFCVDYRKLNTKTLADAYPLPRMDDCLDSLGDAAVFSTLDCNSGYWQVPCPTRT